MLGGKIYCNPCADKMFAAKAGTGLAGAENTSGQGGSAVVPAEIGGWNWGAFLLSWIWGVGNSVWIGLLALIPYLGLIMAIILGVKGNEWAWRYKKWDSVEHFKRTQRTWTKWGLGVVLGSIVLSILIWVLIFTAILSAGSKYPYY
jgi:hypothetical protein